MSVFMAGANLNVVVCTGQGCGQGCGLVMGCGEEMLPQLVPLLALLEHHQL